MAVTTDPQTAQSQDSMPSGKATPQAAYSPQPCSPGIIDVRRALVETNLKEEILSMFNPEHGPRKLPTLLLYDEKGLQLFEEITYLEEYYLTNYEIGVLSRSAVDIADKIPPGSMVIELGSGNLRKVRLLLQALDDAGKPTDYYALDLSRKELERTLQQLPRFQHVRCHGLWGTYDDGHAWLKQPSIMTRPKCILHMGSSIGNMNFREAAAFLKGFTDVLQTSDAMLIGVDSCNDPGKVFRAYNDDAGLTHRFLLNGLHNANRVLGENVFQEGDWKVFGEYVYDSDGGRHQAFFSPLTDTTVMGSLIRPHERIQVEQSFKYSTRQTEMLWNMAGMTEIGCWSRNDEYGLHMLKRSSMPFSLLSKAYAMSPLPLMADWEAAWETWDLVTRGMLPQESVFDKPIKLRNACIFYLGHIPTFLDIQLTKTTKDPPTDPGYYHSIFERGIDPDVDNPERCHAHSEIPDEWPPVDKITEYQQRVRSRLGDLYQHGHGAISKHVGRAIWVSFEHELMHLETLLYMMLQSDKTIPPPQIEPPNFEQLSREARAAKVPNRWYDVPEQLIHVGLDDPEDSTDINAHFGWDNEKPRRPVRVHAFQAQGRPITNEEYAHYMLTNEVDDLPASWVTVHNAPSGQQLSTAAVNGSGPNLHRDGKQSYGCINGRSNGQARLHQSFLEDIAVRTVYGPVPLKLALDWPIFASYDELAQCAAWMGGRIPTFEEARSIYAYVDHLKKGDAEKKLGKTVPAVNGHLVNDGVEETPPYGRQQPVEESHVNGLFVNLDGANVGFQHWHPIAVTGERDRPAGQSEMGGVWEWTSSPLKKHEGFEPMALYPGYTADFFDEKHNIVLGGSWATHPRIAGRKSFVNWYQRNYPYTWAGARLVRSIQ